MEHDAADRSRYPLTIDPGSSTPINFAESINFSPFQKIRTLSFSQWERPSASLYRNT